MARISMKGPGTVAEIAGILKERIPECGWSRELIEHVSRGATELLVFEKPSFRDACLSLSVLLSSDGGYLTVDAISSGEREGLFGLTRCLEDDFAFEVNKILAPMGFVVFDRSTEFVEPWEPAEPPEPVDVNELMRRGKEAARAEKQPSEDADWQEVKDEPERVKLGREEKKGLFSRKSKKPDWEY